MGTQGLSLRPGWKFHVAMKSELLMSICEQQMGAGQLGAFHKSIIDRCTASVYHELIASGGKSRQPILSDWRNELKRQPERAASVCSWPERAVYGAAFGFTGAAQCLSLLFSNVRVSNRTVKRLLGKKIPEKMMR